MTAHIDDGALPARYTTITRNGSDAVDGEIIHERLVSVFVNGQELLTAMCSPIQQDALAVGFLANEGVITSMDDVRDVHICPSGACVDVWLARADFEPPRRMILTSGCGGGITFQDLSQSFPPLESEIRATPERLWALMDDLNAAAALYSRARGVHTSGLSDGQRLLMVAEDVGRHNTLDKLRGMALMQGIDTHDTILLSTGRVSSEMITKARHMGAPIVASRTSPTSLSTALAEEWNITLVGYLRRNSMNVYTHPGRIVRETQAEAALSEKRLMPDNISLTIDGHEISVAPGTTVLKAAEQNGIEVPHVCYHDALTPPAVCRVCVVEVEKARVLAASCVAQCSEGMVVHTRSERVERSRRTILEMLNSAVDLSEAPAIQPMLDGYHADRERFPDGEKRDIELKDDNPFYIRDYSQCIMCWRCVEACAEDGQFAFALNYGGRGFESHITTFEDQPLPETTCVFCGLCVGVCPTGALKPKAQWGLEQGFSQDEVWQMTRRRKKRKDSTLDKS